MNKHITIKHDQPTLTVEETIELLNKAGYKAAICDTWVKEYDVKLRCGTPEEVCSESYDWIKVPKSFVGNDVRYYVRAKGDSMVDQGICDGDKLLIRATEVAQEEDIVVAMINNECTIKVFYRSDDGEVYLVPRNEKYLPILVRESDDFSIVGVVEEVIKAKPRVSGRICRKIIKDAKLKKALSATLTENMVKSAIIKIAPKISYSRQWYSVFRVLLDRGYYSDLSSLPTFVSDMAVWFPDSNINLDAYDLGRMADGCFRKPVAYWCAEEAPVTGKRYSDYLDIATTFSKVL